MSIVGSFNFDMRNAYINTELMLVVDSTELNQQLRNNMAEFEANAAVVKSISEYEELPEGLELKEIDSKKRNFKRYFGWILKRFRFLL